MLVELHVFEEAKYVVKIEADSVQKAEEMYYDNPDLYLTPENYYSGTTAIGLVQVLKEEGGTDDTPDS